MGNRSNWLVAACFAATIVIAGAALAQDKDDARSQDVAPASDTPQFAVADVHPSRGDVDERGSAAIELGPQYRLSPTVTLGGWLRPPGIGVDGAVDRERYVFGLRISR